MKVRIFVDGACSENPGPGGWAVVFNNALECKVLKGHEKVTTNNRMELMAIVISLESISKSGSNKNYYEIFSDSAYVVNAINSSWIGIWKENGWKTTRGEEIKNQDLWIRYLKAMDNINRLGIKLTITKIKGHSGNTFNEYVDKIAKAEILKARSISNNMNGGINNVNN